MRFSTIHPIQHLKELCIFAIETIFEKGTKYFRCERYLAHAFMILIHEHGIYLSDSLKTFFISDIFLQIFVSIVISISTHAHTGIFEQELECYKYLQDIFSRI